MTNQEIADFLATRVMGWKPVHTGGTPFWWESTPNGPQIMIAKDDYDPATDLNQAVQAAEKLKTEKGWAWGIRSVIEPIYSPVGGSTCYRKGYYAYCRVTEAFSTIGSADALARAVVKAAGGDGGN